jgi:hypothetical protein
MSVTVHAYVAMSEDEQIMTMAAQYSRIARMYLPKAKELEQLGMWPSHAPRTLEKSAEIRLKNPMSLHQRAKKAIEIVVTQICLVWSVVKREQ